VMFSWMTAGRAWGNITQTTADGRYPTRIELLNDADVQVNQYGGDVQILVNNVERFLWPVGDLWYEPAYTVPGRFLGMSPITYHARKIGLGIGAEKFGADFFAAGAHPTHLFKMPGQPTEDQAKDFKARLMDVMRGNREPLVVPLDTVVEKMQVDPEDSQFIDAQRYTVEQICRIFNEDPVDHGSSGGGTGTTYANRRDADLARLKRRQFWITKLQNVLTSLLPRPQVVKLNTSAFLMMTDAERAEIHDRRLKNKTRTINEVRRIEDEKPFDGDEYDEPGIPGGNPPETKVEEGT
jgi:HK97 family phage portal protein